MRSTIYSSLLDDVCQAYQESISSDLMLMIPVFLRASVVGNACREEALAAFLKKAFFDVNERCEHQEIAAFVYSLGNLLRSLGDFREAFHYYWKAKKLDPQYLVRDYYYREIAGVLFHLYKFKTSAWLYLQAYEIGKDPKAIALHADSLMFNGQYREALVKFNDYINSSSPEDFGVIEWTLKQSCLDYIVNGCSISNQIRQPQLAKEINSDGKPNMESLKKAIEADALSGLVWFNLGCLFRNESNWNHAAMCYLICGLIQPNDIEAWVNAVLCTFNSKLSSEHLALVITQAYKINKESFLSELYQCLYASLEPEIASTMSGMFETVVNEVRIQLKHQEPFIVRYDGETVYSHNYE